MYILMVYFCFFAIKETYSLTFIDAITIMAIGSLGIVMPVPGGIGTYHAIVIAVLVQIYSISQDTSTTFAYLTHTSQIVSIIVIGGISYFILFFFKKMPIHEKT
jgi:hypothetical protein